MRELHNVTEKFSSIGELEDCLICELELELDTPTLSVGYFEGRNHSKKWLIAEQDLEIMYKKCSRELSLWCEADKENEPVRKKRKEKETGNVTKRQKREEDMDQLVEKLQEKHGELLTVLQYRLWARTILSGVHDDMNNPPPLPMIKGYAPKSQKKDSLCDAIAGAATAVVKVLNGPSTSPSGSAPGSSAVYTSPSSTVTSPTVCADIRMKNLEQLRYLQQLLDDGILSSEEFLEQKRMILDTLRKI